MPSRYDGEMKAKAVRLVREHGEEYGTEWAAIRTISARLGMSAETLRKWVRQAEVHAGQAPGLPTESAREPRELKRMNKELEVTIEVLKAATTFFASMRGWPVSGGVRSFFRCPGLGLVACRDVRPRRAPSGGAVA